MIEKSIGAAYKEKVPETFILLQLVGLYSRLDTENGYEQRFTLMP